MKYQLPVSGYILAVATHSLYFCIGCDGTRFYGNDADFGIQLEIWVLRRSVIKGFARVADYVYAASLKSIMNLVPSTLSSFTTPLN
jgi:hypothetical protein